MEKPVATERTTEKPVAAEPRQPRPPRPPRPPKNPTEPRIVEEKPVIDAPVVATTGEGETEAEKTEKSSARRRGRRGGRREREKRDVVPGTEDNSVEGTESASNENVATEQPAARVAKPTEYVAMPSNMKASAVVAASAETAAPVVTAAVVVTAPVVTAAVAIETKPAAQGLVQIETAPSKVAAIVEATERPAPVIRRRSRPLEVYVENEPLVQIETQNPKA